MDAATVLIEAREKLDDAVAPYLWSDEELARYLNNGCDEICLRTRGLQDSRSDLCTIALLVGVATYALDPAIYVVRRASISGVGDQLTRCNARQLDRCHSGWDDSTRYQNARPQYAVFDMDSRSITLFPTPDVVGSLRLTVWRRPTEGERVDVTGDLSEIPVIPDHLHAELKYWIAHEAFSNKDSEKYDDKRAGDFLALFTSRVGERPSAHQLHVWSTSPIRGTTAHYT
jgi:hypothetical protein